MNHSTHRHEKKFCCPFECTVVPYSTNPCSLGSVGVHIATITFALCHLGWWLFNVKYTLNQYWTLNICYNLGEQTMYGFLFADYHKKFLTSYPRNSNTPDQCVVHIWCCKNLLRPYTQTGAEARTGAEAVVHAIHCMTCWSLCVSVFFSIRWIRPINHVTSKCQCGSIWWKPTLFLNHVTSKESFPRYTFPIFPQLPMVEAFDEGPPPHLILNSIASKTWDHVYKEPDCSYC